MVRCNGSSLREKKGRVGIVPAVKKVKGGLWNGRRRRGIKVEGWRGEKGAGRVPAKGEEQGIRIFLHRSREQTTELQNCSSLK